MESFLEAIRWDLVGGGFQIALCAVILGGWVRRRIRKRAETRAEPSAPNPDFSQEVFLQTIRQQTELSLQRILAAVEVERDQLQRALASTGVLNPPAAVEIAGSEDPHSAFRWGDSDADGTGRRRYAGLKALAEQGLSSRQIADRLNLPAGEIQLALKLQGATHEIDRVDEIRQ